MIDMRFPDGRTKAYPVGITPEAIAGDISSGLRKKTVAAFVDGDLYDLNRPINQAATIELITQDHPRAFEVLNHSTAHLMAQAVRRLYGDALFGVGPAIEEGFYYDIATDATIRQEDLPAIEAVMQQIVQEKIEMHREELTREAALQRFEGDPYKTELIRELPEDEPISIYTQGEFVDLCRGGHIGNTGHIKHFKLLSVAGAYWRGKSENAMLQRIYGTSWFSRDALDAHLAILEDRKARDHRKLGKELKIFELNQDAGQGLALWLPNGYTVRKVLEDYVYNLERRAGYKHVSTPVLGTKKLYEISGHFAHYKENMFPLMSRDGEEFVLRPMSCPHHMIIYKSELRSYRDLPLRLAEIVIMHRYEASGALSGLERVRAMTLTDSHIFVRKDQIKAEALAAYKLILQAIQDLGLQIDYVELALRDNEKGKFHDNDALWDTAEAMLKELLIEENIEHVEVKGEAAFYGPKIDIQVRTAMNHVITMSTVQLDFLLPERFDLTYIGQDGEKHRPVVIHRGLISTWERLMSILLEQYKGAFPTWLAPVQVKVLPVNIDSHQAYAEEVNEHFLDETFRSELDARPEKLGYRIREAQTQKIPYQIVIGDQEVADRSVTYRRYGEQAQTTVPLDTFVTLMHTVIRDKS